MSSWLAGQGHTVTVVVGGEGVYCDELARRSISFRSCQLLQRPVNLGHDLLAVRELRRIFRDESPDLISLHSAKAGILGRLAAAGLQSAVLFTAHGWSFTDGIPKKKAFVYRAGERLVANLADRIITVSEYDRSLALRFGVGHPDKIIAIHNAMHDVNERANVGENDAATRIVMVARLDDQKDHRTLFHALSGIMDRSWELGLVGDGPLESELQALAVEVGIEERVNFLGLRSDVAKIMSKAHIFVLASNWEGFPRSILEAMRAGLPIIASDVGGVSEAIQHGETGYVVGAQDFSALRSRIISLLEHPEERVRMGDNARASFEELFMFNRMATETLAVYQSVLEQQI
jgi:glycosyltransferase involved in cell wall biosynthesis